MSTESENLSKAPLDNDVPPTENVNPIAVHKSKIEMAVTLAEKSDILWALPANVRHETLGALSAPAVAALIESAPEQNMRLLANMPADKFTQITALGSAEQGRSWFERAVTSGSLAGAILPSLLTSRDLAEMLLTSPDVRRALPRLLNFERAQRWRQLLTTNEWHANIDELLMADAEELLTKAPIKDKAVKAVLHSLLDFVPELYLETVSAAIEKSKYREDRPEEWEDITSTPFGMPEFNQTQPDAAAQPAAEAATVSPLDDVLPEGGDPVFALATAGLTGARKTVLENQLRSLLRQEIVATASFSVADMQRAAGRVLFYLRVGLESFGPSVEDATRALETRNLNDISATGARAAEALRQKALGLAGLRDWLDSRQRQFLEAMKQPEAGVDPETREPVLWLAGKIRQPRAEWHAMPIAEVTAYTQNIASWGSLARAAFGTAERVHAILGTAKTRTAEEALRRTVIALVLYRRWEPELVQEPLEDYESFRRQYGTGKKNGIDTVRDIVLKALDDTPAAAWKPSDAKARARELLLRAVDEIERNPSPSGQAKRATTPKAH